MAGQGLSQCRDEQETPMRDQAANSLFWTSTDAPQSSGCEPPRLSISRGLTLQSAGNGCHHPPIPK